MEKTIQYRSLIISIEAPDAKVSNESEFHWKVKRQDGSVEEESDFGCETEEEAIHDAKEFIDSWYE